MAKGKKKKKTTGMAVALWFLAFLVILVVFLAKKDTIFPNLKYAAEKIQGKETTAEPSKSSKPKQNDLIQIDVEPETVEKTPAPTTPSVTEKASAKETTPVAPEKTAETKASVTDKNAKKTETKPAPSTTSPTEAKAEPPKEPEKPKIQTINATLYFVQIDGDGRVNLKSCPRSLKKSDSPLTDVIKTLLAGPTYEEKTKNAMTAIPAGTRLISATVKNGVAYLNFSEEFQFNTLGVEGYLAQLRQIVYTATTFSTVNSVQFLIDGQKTDYLGSEGVWIGSPIGR